MINDNLGTYQNFSGYKMFISIIKDLIPNGIDQNPHRDSIKLNALSLLGESKELCPHVSVGHPINNVEHEKYWRRYPHCPSVYVVH